MNQSRNERLAGGPGDDAGADALAAATAPDPAPAAPQAATGPASQDPDDGAVNPARVAFVPRATVTAFVATEGFGRSLAAAGADRRMSRVSLDLVAGGLETAVEHFAEHPVPDVILAETEGGPGAILAALEALAERCPPGTALVIVGHVNDVALYRRLLQAGVGDYLVAPVRPLQIVEAMAQLLGEGAEGERAGSVIAFIGARGGAGSSVVAVNTAAAMTRRHGLALLLADLDLAWGTVALELDLEPPQGVRDAIEAGERLDEALLDRLVAQRDERLGVLASPASLEVADAAETVEESLERLVGVARKVTPHLLLDLPHRWGPLIRRALLVADEIVVTVTPDLASMRNARNLLAELKSARPNDPAPRVVLNQAGMPKRREIRPEDLQRVLEIAPVAEVPYDAAAFSAATTSGKPVAESRSNAAAAAAFETLAGLLTGRAAQPAKRTGLAGLARRLLKP